MKKIIIVIALVFAAFSVAYAQNAAEFLGRYNSLVKRVGYSGIGVETLIDKWEQADPSDVNQMVARFNFYFDKCRSAVTRIHPEPEYLGAKPAVTLKDSTGANVYYYTEYEYEKEMYDKAMQTLDEALAAGPERLDLCILKVEALMVYEKGKPVLSQEYLKSLVDGTLSGKMVWKDGERTLSKEDFLNEIQALCCEYFALGTPEACKAMKDVSQRVLKYSPRSVEFIDNLGAYCVKVEKNDKKAMKYYRKSLSIEPEDAVARQNVQLIERRMKSKKK